MAWDMMTGFAGDIIGSILGGGKKAGSAEAIAEANPLTTITHAPYETYVYAPSSSHAYDYSYQGGDVILNSPYASTKKEATQEATAQSESKPYVSVPTSVSQPVSQQPSATATAGIDNMTIILVALIGGAALIGYSLFKT